MLPALAVFLIVAGFIVGGYLAFGRLTKEVAQRRMDERLRDLGPVADLPDQTVVKRVVVGPLPAVERFVARTGAGTRLTQLIEQSGVHTTPSTIIIASILAGSGAAFICSLFIRYPFAPLVVGLLGTSLPTLWLFQRRGARFRKFEEQFPDALDLLSRALRAGHAFQAALGMVADELPAPVGLECRKTFEQQNFGLPLKDALNELAQRIPILDVQFFVTAVSIQRESGGNLAEILDNLAHVVRERFKIQRQVRVHTAHGRFTGYVLLALPAALAAVLSYLSPEHMNLMFNEPLGRTMLIGAVVLQTIGFFWIRHVIKIEV